MIGVSYKYIPNCVSNIPDVYANIEEFKQLARSYDLELLTLDDQINTIYNNFHVETLNEYGCERWEKILNIKVNSDYTLNDRRFNIKVKLLGFLPYTYLKLHDILKNLVGEGNYLLDLDRTTNHLTCKLDLGIKNQLNAAREMLEKVIPLNISLEVDLLYNTHNMLSTYTHNELSKYTHEELRSSKLAIKGEVVHG